MNEALLHYIWQFRQYAPLGLKTQANETLEVLKPGVHNTDAGPDFENARLRIGALDWAGNVEIHIHSSDWNKHGHQRDVAYNNVVLHVVWRDDVVVFKEDGEPLTTLVLEPLVKKELLSRYERLMEGKRWIPCEEFIGETDRFHLQQFLERLLIERLEQKSEEVKTVLQSNKNDWEETFYLFFCRAIGLKINVIPMERLAQLLPQKILSKHKGNLLQLEALLLGVGGFLVEPQDAYSKILFKEFQFLKHKYQLSTMTKSDWKLFRLRPIAFPTVRLAQLAQLMHHNTRLFARIIKQERLKDIVGLLKVELSGYWRTHYRLAQKSVYRKKSFGKGQHHY